MELNKRLISLRKNIRLNHKSIINSLTNRSDEKICVFCGSKNSLTKEHVLPKWTFEGCTKKSFITNTNGISQKYNQTVIPCCNNCNNYILAFLEDSIIEKFQKINLSEEDFTIDQLEKEIIILWLETITYKLQAMEMKRKLKKVKDVDFIPYLADFPIAIMQNLSLSPAKVFSNLRNSLKRLSKKSKINRLNSLVVFKTKNTNFSFMHSANNFIYIELPKQEIALFYFILEDFDEHVDAYNKCMEILKEEYKQIHITSTRKAHWLDISRNIKWERKKFCVSYH